MDTAGHAHHFLSRLDRLSMPHVELALSFYRDHELVRYILGAARIPEGAARVAMALADGDSGPFLVVTRDGKFVTCLGEGMHTGELHVITRGHLDKIADKLGALRERMALAKRLTGAKGTAELFRQIYDAAHRLSREQVAAMAAFQPLLAVELLGCLLDADVDQAKARDILLYELRRTDRLDKRFDESLHAYWCTAWAIGHLSVLTAMDGRVAFDRFPAEVMDRLAEYPYSWPAVRQQVVGIAIRGLWGAARMGKMFLPIYKRECAEATSIPELVNGVFGLGAIGMRHARVRAEAQKALTPAKEGKDAATPEPYQAVRAAVASVLTIDPGEPALRQAHTRLGAKLAVVYGKNAPEGSPYRFVREADVPPDIADAMLAFDMTGFRAHPQVLSGLLTSLSWLARAEAEELYFTADHLAAWRISWDPGYTTSLLLEERDAMDRARAASRARKAEKSPPARNAPCPCGSGKKHKRCCGAERA
ncbi:YecA family protein [Polyangium aurulentum]|uniref:YecA family protein n=1 Tax=Polyangium aurulentum TaxID=2567896 RepID=UPI0010ADA673|nr:SEC-C domain-containing protein [Polyangium aurulentum]UQA56643.1 SEC-C domain-containing protein [Polyangium aurulentum]